MSTDLELLSQLSGGRGRAAPAGQGGSPQWQQAGFRSGSSDNGSLDIRPDESASNVGGPKTAAAAGAGTPDGDIAAGTQPRRLPGHTAYGDSSWLQSITGDWLR
jgi:hypothetical protein